MSFLRHSPVTYHRIDVIVVKVTDPTKQYCDMPGAFKFDPRVAYLLLVFVVKGTRASL